LKTRLPAKVESGHSCKAAKCRKLPIRLDFPFDARQDSANFCHPGRYLELTWSSHAEFRCRLQRSFGFAGRTGCCHLPLVLPAWVFIGLARKGWFPVLDSANLAVHEAGHPLVSIFSARATVYGGTLFQLAFPLAAAWHFYRAANASGTAAAIVWLGENLFNIARYMADARARQLPLVGNGEHDWAEIFSRWGVLNLDGRIAGVTSGIGVILVAGAAAWLYRRWQADREYSAP